MKDYRTFRIWVALLLTAVLSSSCAHRSRYNPKYLDDEFGGGARVDGRSYLYIFEDDEDVVHKCGPGNPEDVGPVVEIPTGEMNSKIAFATLGKIFSKGARLTYRLSKYRKDPQIQARVVSFDWRYNHEKGATLTAVPEVNLSIHVRVLLRRDVLLSKAYDSGSFSASAPPALQKPAELVNYTAHRAMQALYSDAALDIQAAVTGIPRIKELIFDRTRPPPPPRPPEPEPEAWEDQEGWEEPVEEPEYVPEAPEPVVSTAPGTMPELKARTPAARLSGLKELYQAGLVDEDTYRTKQQDILKNL